MVSLTILYRYLVVRSLVCYGSRMLRKDHSKPVTKNDIEVAVAQISNAVMKATENVATKDDLKNVATKDDLKQVEKRLEAKIDIVASDVSDIRRRVIDLEHDTPNQKEVDDLKKFVGFTAKT